MPRVIEFHDHGRIAAGGDDPACGRFLSDLVAFQELGSPGAFNAILAVEDTCGPAIGILNGACIRERFDSTGAFLAIVAIADNACDRSADRFEFDASA
jgi:hypothetical protein